MSPLASPNAPRRRALASPGLIAAALVWLALGFGVGAYAQSEAPRWLGALAAGGVELAHPERLWGLLAAWLLPLLGLGAVADLPRWQTALATVLRMATVAALVLAIAAPRARQERPRNLAVVHLVDVSGSMAPAALARAATAIEADLAETRREEAAVADTLPTDALEDELDATAGTGRLQHVVAFGAGPQRLPWPPTATESEETAAALPPLLPWLQRATSAPLGADLGDGGPLVAAPTAGPAAGPRRADATDLESALDLAIGLLDPDRVGHVVVWSDGAETRGDARRTLSTLRRAGISVHRGDLGVLAANGEVVVEGAIVPPRVRANVPAPIALRVATTRPAKVSCRADGTAGAGAKIALGPVVADLTPGVTTVELGKGRWREAGAHDLDLRCAVIGGEDQHDGNNAVRARIVVVARPKVLYVEGTPPSARTLARALEDDFELTLRGPEGLPRDVAGLQGFDAVIVSDLARITAAGVPQVGDAEQRALGRYAERGGGLLFVGGEDALGSGGWEGSWLEKQVLPVRLEVKSTVEEPSIALMLVLDRSGSMAGPKMDLAKEAARATAEALGHEDRIGIVAFDNMPRSVVPLQRAGNRYRIATRIDGISPSGGTHIYPALQMAAAELERAHAKVKHVILLSDGQAPRAGIDALVRQMRRSQITVTAVGIGDEIDRGLLEAIADRGGGRAWFTDRPENLPRIFLRETKEIAGQSLVERRVRAKLAPGVGRLELLRGVDLGRSPVLRGFLTSKPKPGAEELLRVSSGEPLLVRWRLGLGKVSVWTSDLKNRWAQDWIDWSGYAVLARQLVRDVLLEDLSAEADVQLQREDERLRVTVDAVLDDLPAGGLLATATLRPPTGPGRTLALTEVAPGRYEAMAPMAEFGAYDVAVELRAAPKEPALLRGRASLSRPYPDEFRAVTAGAGGLDEVVAATGGSAVARRVDWQQRGNATWRSWRPLWPTLVALALLLLPLELLLRRVRLGRARAGSWFDRPA